MSTPAQEWDTPSFELAAGDYLAGELQVLALRGAEEVSRPFAFDVTVVSASLDMESLEEALLGANARLTLHGASASRVVHAIVDRVTYREEHGAHALQRCKLRLVSRLALLAHRVNTRIFQDQPVPDIVEAVLREHRIECDWRLTQRYAPHAYCVQYHESDLEFVQRLLAQIGVFYFFSSASTGASGAGLDFREVLSLSDAASAYQPIPGDPVLPVALSDGRSGDGEFVTRFGLRRQVFTGAVAQRDYYFLSPSADPHAVAQVDETLPSFNERPLEVYDHHGEHEELDVSPARARTMLQQERRRASVGRGRSPSRRVAPGHWFALDDHSVHRVNREYAVTRVVHEGAQLDVVPGAKPPREGASLRSYENRFECVPRDVPCRPPQARERRISQVLETATVVGPAGEEIYTDPYGRIKVQFHWDRDGRRNEHSSCWIRVAQAWAGANWGTQFIPRVGMEVLVTFLGGDQDRPVVTGCLYNQEMMPPFELPESKEMSGIRTRSTPDGRGSNELRFEDGAGRERVYVHAQKDLDTVVENDRTGRVVGSESLQVGRDRTRTVGGDESVTVDGDHVRTVQGNEVVTIYKNLVLHVLGNQTIMVKGQPVDAPKTPRAQDPASHDGDGRPTMPEAHAPEVETGDGRVGGDASGGGGGDKKWSGGEASSSTLEITGNGVISASGDLTIKTGNVTITGGEINIKGGKINLNC